MRLRHLFVVLVSLLAAAPSLARGTSDTFAIVVVMEEGGSKGASVAQIQAPLLLRRACADSRAIAPLCDEIDALEGASSSAVLTELFRNGWDLEETIPVLWHGPDDGASCEAAAGGVTVDVSQGDLTIRGDDGDNLAHSWQLQDAWVKSWSTSGDADAAPCADAVQERVADGTFLMPIEDVFSVESTVSHVGFVYTLVAP